MAVEIIRRGSLRPITDLPATTDPDGYVELERAGEFFSVPSSYLSGGDPALSPLGTELADYSSEFLTAPTGWTWLNQGTSTISYALSRAIIVPQEGGAGVNALRLFGPPTFPAAPWTVRARLLNWSSFADVGGGFFAYRTANARIVTPQITLRAAVSAGAYFTENWYYLTWSNFATVNSVILGPTVNDVRSRDRFIQFRCDGTTLFFDFSPDNARFLNLTSTPLATYIGGEPDRVGIFANNATATGGQEIGYDWFRVYGDAALNRS